MELLLSFEYLPFTIALLGMVALVAVELLAIFVLVEGSFTGLRDLDMGFLPDSRLKSWLEVDDMPFTVFFCLALGGFGGMGILCQRAFEGVFGGPLPALLAVPLVLGLTLVVLKGFTSAGSLPADLLHKLVLKMDAAKEAKRRLAEAPPMTMAERSSEMLKKAKQTVSAMPSAGALAEQAKAKVAASPKATHLLDKAKQTVSSLPSAGALAEQAKAKVAASPKATQLLDKARQRMGTPSLEKSQASAPNDPPAPD